MEPYTDEQLRDLNCQIAFGLGFKWVKPNPCHKYPETRLLVHPDTPTKEMSYWHDALGHEPLDRMYWSSVPEYSTSFDGMDQLWTALNRLGYDVDVETRPVKNMGAVNVAVRISNECMSVCRSAPMRPLALALTAGEMFLKTSYHWKTPTEKR